MDIINNTDVIYDDFTGKPIIFNGPSLIYKNIYSYEYPIEKSYDKHITTVYPTWSTNTSSLYRIYTSSNQPHRTKIYYRCLNLNFFIEFEDILVLIFIL